jgi:predicted NUDIX family NTP pyrophosphohydrolase
MKTSAGILAYRLGGSGLEVLLVHPSGNYNRHKPWSIPKGLPDPGESLEAAARRETLEETGLAAQGPLAPLGSVTYQRSGKTIHAFGAQAPPEAAPCCASWEVDRAEFLPLDEARQRIHPDQRVFLDRLATLLEARPQEDGGG